MFFIFIVVLRTRKRLTSKDVAAGKGLINNKKQTLMYYYSENWVWPKKQTNRINAVEM
jgi:hypothetical protein